MQKSIQRKAKRGLDVAISLISLLLLSPLFVLVAALIKTTSDKSPVFYEWEVVGKDGKPFTSYKFRTMCDHADGRKSELRDRNEMKGPVFKMKNDPRITPIGKVLRKFSIDEFPQLYSVLKADMSLIGPRPPLQYEYEKFEEWQERKLSVKPGMACLREVNGKDKITDFDEWVKLDLEYIDNWSLWLDIKILVKTAIVILLGQNY